MFRRITILLAVSLLTAAGPARAEYKPDPNWKIAFLRGKNLWVMNADGSGQREIANPDNIVGRLSWSNDGKRIVHARQGQMQVVYPNGMGGNHRCYDLFVAHIDSAGKNWWWQITDNLGSMFPEWSADDQLFVCVQDKAANFVNSLFPEYRICVRNWNGTIEEYLAPADADAGSYLGIQPTMSPDKKTVAYVHMERKGELATDLKEYGLVVVPRAGPLPGEEELRAQAALFPDVGGPAFSPDGKHIAYINTKDYSIYIVNVVDKTKRMIFAPDKGVQPRPNATSWSPDGRWLTFSSYDGHVYVIGADGNDLKQLSFGGNDYSPAFSK